jgi:hypothetical protein
MNEEYTLPALEKVEPFSFNTNFLGGAMLIVTVSLD